MVKLNRDNMVAANATVNKGNSRGKGGVTLVYHENGKRIEFSKIVFEKLGNPTALDFSYCDEYLVITSSSDGNLVKEMGAKKVIYNAELVKDILNHFNIDFSEQSCFTFSEFDFVEEMENSIAVKIR